VLGDERGDAEVLAMVPALLIVDRAGVAGDEERLVVRHQAPDVGVQVGALRHRVLAVVELRPPADRGRTRDLL
jgi:hypothetical protein